MCLVRMCMCLVCVSHIHMCVCICSVCSSSFENLVFPSLQSLNFTFTHALLDLVVLYASVLILISQIDDRKAILGLFNHAFEIGRGNA